MSKQPKEVQEVQEVQPEQVQPEQPEKKRERIPEPGKTPRRAAFEYVRALSNQLVAGATFSIPEEDIRKGIAKHLKVTEDLLNAEERELAELGELKAEVERLNQELTRAEEREAALTQTLAETRRKLREPVTEGGEEDMIKLRKRRLKKAQQEDQEEQEGIDPFADDPDGLAALPEYLRGG